MEGMSKPVPGDWGWSGPAAELSWDYSSDRAAHNYSLAYRKLRQLGVAHEDAVQGAQRQTYGQVCSQNPEPVPTWGRTYSVYPDATAGGEIASDLIEMGLKLGTITPDSGYDIRVPLNRK